MKNIHIISTDKKPIKGDLLLRHLWKGKSNECVSWWRYDKTITIDGVVQHTTLNGSFRDIISSFKVQHIYITSDEEITGFENNIWVIKGDRVFLWQNTMALVSNNKPRKIILTTDQDLIKDGVQAISDEFLEWFVKNPSCEVVEVKKEYITPLGDIVETCYDNERLNYKIIIPKTTQQIIDEDFAGGLEMGQIIPKEETLEEVAEKWNEKQTTLEFGKPHNAPNRIKAFIEGAEWQQKRSYSEEDIALAFNEGQAYSVRGKLVDGKEWVKEHKKEWFEQFKNK